MDKIHAFKVHDGHVDPPYCISLFDEKITCPHCRKLKGLPQLEKQKSMYISNLLIENFRIFGCDDESLELEINPGLTALIGENDEGKSTIIDAIRFVLGTNDHNYTRIEDSDFHWYESDAGEEGESKEIKLANEIWVQCKFSGLSVSNMGDFAEHLTYEEDGNTSLYVNWVAHREKGRRIRRWAEVFSGKNKEGPAMLAESRELLKVTYLRPLRDAEREMSAGKNSRLSQILHATDDIKLKPNASGKTLLQVSDEAFTEIAQHPSIHSTTTSINNMLEELSFDSDILSSEISVNLSREEQTRLRQLLEKLEIDITDISSYKSENRGLGSNNLLFMGCEMLLLESAEDEIPIMLIEEPEAHIHPQRQLLVIEHLQRKAEEEGVQILVTTHSTQLASVIKLQNMALIKSGKAYSLAPDYTELDSSDYRFLERFLDATKANLFFAKGVMIVEGDAENILFPTIAKLVGRDFTKHGVSIVNVGHTGLGRFSRIFRRSNQAEIIDIPVSCVTDLDILPSCAPEILGLDVNAKNRRWSHDGEYNEEELSKKRQELVEKDAGQNVMSFPSELWTLEFDLANNGLLKEVWMAAKLAKEDGNQKSRKDIVNEGKKELEKLGASELSDVEKSVHCYSRFTSSSTEYADGSSKVSKSIAAQHLADILLKRYSDKPEELLEKLPNYVVSAIEHVTGGKFEKGS